MSQKKRHNITSECDYIADEMFEDDYIAPGVRRRHLPSDDDDENFNLEFLLNEENNATVQRDSGRPLCHYKKLP